MRYKGPKGTSWKYFSEYIRKRDKGKCVTCGRKKEDGYQIHAGHLFPVGLVGSNNQLSWDEDNVYAQCAYCNMVGEGMQLEMSDHVIRVHGKEKLEELRSRVHKIDPVKDWKEITEHYKKKIKEL